VCLCEFASCSLSASLSLSHSYPNIYIHIYIILYNSVSRCSRRLLLCGKYRSCVQPLCILPSYPLPATFPAPSTLQQCRGGASTALDRNSPRARKLHPSRRRRTDAGKEMGQIYIVNWKKLTRAQSFRVQIDFSSSPPQRILLYIKKNKYAFVFVLFIKRPVVVSRAVLTLF